MPGNATSTAPTTVDEIRALFEKMNEDWWETFTTNDARAYRQKLGDDLAILSQQTRDLANDNATLRAAVARLAAVEEAAIHLAAQFPDQGAATPHASLGEYGASMLYALRAALRGTEGDDAR